MGKKKNRQNKKNDRKNAKRKAGIRKLKQANAERSNRLKVEEMVDEAMKLVDKKEFKAAERTMSKLRAKHMDHPYVLHGLGVLSGMKGELENAIGYFDKALSINPDMIESRFNKAVAYKEALDVVNTIRAFQDVIKYGDPGENEVLDSQKFLDSFAENLKKNENITIDDFLMANDEFEIARKYMLKKKYEKAIVHYRKAENINPNPPQTFGNMGLCYAALGEHEKAMEAFEKALEIDPEYELAIVNRALVRKLKPGQAMELPVKEVSYYKNYKFGKKSYIKEYLQTKGQLK